MQSWFSKDELRPFVVQLFKSIRQFGMIGTVGNGNGWLNKKSVFKEFDVISNTIGVENLKSIFNFFAINIHKSLPGGHYIKFSI